MNLRIEDIILKLYQKDPYLGPLCFVDTETTGLEKTARIIEIGAICTSYDGFNVHFSMFEELINPGFAVSDKITEITGITNEELSKARGDEVYTDFHRWVIQNAPTKCVAHNAAFDKRMFEYNLIRTGFGMFLPDFDCTMRLAQKYLTGPKANNLKVLSEWFNFKNTQAHRALSDTETCAHVYAKILLGEYE